MTEITISADQRQIVGAIIGGLVASAWIGVYGRLVHDLTQGRTEAGLRVVFSEMLAIVSASLPIDSPFRDALRQYETSSEMSGRIKSILETN